MITDWLSIESIDKPASAKKDLVGAYYRHVTITPVPQTLLVEISAVFCDRTLTATVANAHAAAYLAHIQDQRLGATGEASEWLQSQSRELQAKLEKSEAALQAYREKNQMVSLEERQNIVVEKLKQLNEQVTTAKNQRIIVENNYKQLKVVKERKGDPSTLPFVIQNTVIQDLKKQITDKSGQVAKLQERYLDKHPALIQARSELEDVQQQFKQEVDKVLASVEADYQLAISREKTMEQALKDQEQAAMALNEKQIGYETLKRQADADRQMYEAVLGRMKQTSVSKQLDTSNITVLDQAVEPLRKYRPRRTLNIAIAFLLSLVFGGVICVLMESLTETVREPDNFTTNEKIPFLGYVPHRPRRIFRRFSPIVTDVDSACSEAYRTALAVLSLQPESMNATCFLVTSAVPGEGKTTCAINLAASFADKGLATLLIEADLRHPTIRKGLRLEKGAGLERLAVNGAGREDLIQPLSHPNLSVVAARTPAANPHALLASPIIQEYLASVRQQYARIVIDTPPVGAVSDALSLCPLADGVVWVVRFNKARRKVIQDAFARLVQVKARVFGFLINDVDFTSRHNRYYYSYHGYDTYYHKRK
jgi:capsular exopolysaccharide synthesis family protein